MTMRLLVDNVLGPNSGSIGSPGIDELRWVKPVRPGDTLRVRVEVVEVTPSRSKPDRGTAKFRYLVLNQKDETVMTMVGLGMFLRRIAP
jgi:acyl dehydratase